MRTYCAWTIAWVAVFLPGCRGGWQWAVGAIVVAATAVLIVRHWRKVRVKHGVEAMTDLFDWMEGLVPGMRIVADETPGTFQIVRGSGRMDLDLYSLWRAAHGRTDDLEESVAAWLFHELSEHAGTTVRARTERELTAVLASVGGTLEAASSSDCIVFVGGERRTIPRAALVAQVWGIEDEEERRAIFSGWMRELAGADIDDLRERVRPMFLTPARDRRKAALLAGLQEQTGLVARIADGFDDVTREIPGLPFRLGYVQDLGARVARISHAWVEQHGLDETALFELALDNLASDQLVERLPDDGEVLVIQDPEGYAASAVLLLPEELENNGAALVAVSPAPEVLMLGWDGDRKALVELGRVMRAADDAAPLPVPIRITSSGFEAVKWSGVGVSDA